MSTIKEIRAYKSCFITDVQIGSDNIRLQDTGRNQFFIDMKDKDAVISFNNWFKAVFLKGVAQMPSVFIYEKVNDGEGAFDFYVKKFIINSTAADQH